VSDLALNSAELANTIEGVNKPAPTAVATAEPAIALFKNNLLFIFLSLF
jgi:hypothetical protein